MLIDACAERISYLVPAGQVDEELVELRRCIERATALSREILTARPHLAARKRVDLNHVVARGAVTLSRLTGEGKRVRLRLASEPVIVMAGLAELERIFLNLALNARAATTSDGVVTVETAIVDVLPGQIEGASAGRYAKLTVADTGSGMTPEVMARMFQPFFTTRQEGTGLGLSSVAFSVRQLQGIILVESEPGQGTTVTVYLPLAH